MYITVTLTTYYLAPGPFPTLSEMEYVTLCELDFGPDINACSYMAFTVWSSISINQSINFIILVTRIKNAQPCFMTYESLLRY